MNISIEDFEGLRKKINILDLSTISIDAEIDFFNSNVVYLVLIKAKDQHHDSHLYKVSTLQHALELIDKFFGTT